VKDRRIGIDIRALTPPLTGIGIYCREVLARLARIAPDNDYLCYVTNARARENLPEGRFHLRVGKGFSARWGSVWFQTGVNSLLRADRLDMFWGPLHILPMRMAGRFPMVVTAHDLVFHYYPDTMSWRNRLVLARYAERSFRCADAIMAVSRATADAIVKEFGIEPRLIQVIHNAAAEHFRPRDLRAARERLRQRYSLDGEYILFVGTLEPRKNLDGFLRALRRLAAAGFDGGVVIVGARGWNMAPVSKLVHGHPLESRLHFMGYVPEEDLPSFYSGARIFVMPSIYEGFGLPVVEAMRCGTPVICTDAPPLPEVTGGAAMVVHTGDEEALARAMERAWSDPDLRAGLRDRGLRRAEDFSWDRTTDRVVEVFRRVLGD
jgi:glycosyltransferase involved in cell wall biosynthesis